MTSTSQRFGAGIAGSALAVALANSVGVSLRGNGAPGDRTAALVPNPAGEGYWLVGCEGSVYAFGAAAHLPGTRARVGGHHGVVAAAPTTTGRGLWLVTADGTVATVGDATPLTFSSLRGFGPVVDGAATPTGAGLWAVGSVGRDRDGGRRAQLREHGRPPPQRCHARHRAHTERQGLLDRRLRRRHLLVRRPRFFGSMGATKLNGPVVALAATPDDRGYWLLGSDGGIFSFGDTRYEGNGQWITPRYPINLVVPAPGPATKIVAPLGTREGYWTMNDNGRVVSHGAAIGHAGDNNLALFTP